jgi:hypothetical protein
MTCSKAKEISLISSKNYFCWDLSKIKWITCLKISNKTSLKLYRFKEKKIKLLKNYKKSPTSLSLPPNKNWTSKNVWTTQSHRLKSLWSSWECLSKNRLTSKRRSKEAWRPKMKFTPQPNRLMSRGKSSRSWKEKLTNCKTNSFWRNLNATDLSRELATVICSTSNFRNRSAIYEIR